MGNTAYAKVVSANVMVSRTLEARAQSEGSELQIHKSFPECAVQDNTLDYFGGCSWGDVGPRAALLFVDYGASTLSVAC